MTELEALRHQVKMLEAQLIEQREQSYRANLRDVELHQAAQAEPGEWIEWAGGECPLNDSVRHSIRKRDGWQSAPDIAAADWYGWRHNGSSADIVAYRVLA